MNNTRPDIAYVVGRLSQYTHNLNRDHWNALLRILKYLKGTMYYGLSYCGYSVVFDANWISASTDMKSTNGYIFTLGGGVVSWKSSKQSCIAQSTMEFELLALNKVGSKAEWLHTFFIDVPIRVKPTPFVSLHCDCQATVTRVKSSIYNRKSRHIRLRHKLLR